jgi:hypothetical protein
MSFTADMAFTLDLAGTGTKFSRVVAGPIERAWANSELLSALLTDALNARQFSGGIVISQALGAYCVRAFDRAESLVSRWRSMKDFAADLARNIVFDFIARGYANPTQSETFLVAVVVLVFLGAALRDLLGFTTSSTKYDYAFAGYLIAASAAAQLLVSITSRNGKFLTALLALPTFGEFRGTHKRNLLSDGWHVCLGHAGPTGGIHNYIRLWANHQTQACPKPLHYTTCVLEVLTS